MMRKRDDDLRDLLQNLGRALSAAISDSDEVSRSLDRIQQEGYRLELHLDCKPPKGGAGGESEAGAAQEQGRSRSRPQAQEAPLKPGQRLPLAYRKVAPRGEPRFQIDMQDLAFLRSIGIDPTRRMRRRRG